MSHDVIQWSLALLLLVMFFTATTAFLTTVFRKSNARLAAMCRITKGGGR